MPDTATLFDTRDTLTEDFIRSEPSLSTATSDVLAEPHIFIPRAKDTPPTLRKVTIRKGSVGIQGRMPQFLVNSVQQVAVLLNLQPGWNSYSAKQIEPVNAIRAIELLFELLDSRTPAPIVVPTARGGIQLEWHTRGVNIEIYISSPTDVSFFAEHLESRESTEQPLANHQDELKSWLKRICEQ